MKLHVCIFQVTIPVGEVSILSLFQYYLGIESAPWAYQLMIANLESNTHCLLGSALKKAPNHLVSFAADFWNVTQLPPKRCVTSQKNGCECDYKSSSSDKWCFKPMLFTLTASWPVFALGSNICNAWDMEIRLHKWLLTGSNLQSVRVLFIK